MSISNMYNIINEICHIKFDVIFNIHRTLSYILLIIVSANGGNGMMLSLTTNCPKCQHVFSLGMCGDNTESSCRDGLALSGGGLLWPPSPSPSQSQTIFFPFPSPPEQDLSRLRKTDAHLRLSGWYYEDLTWQESQRVLKNTPPGTFLIRNSSDHKFLYSLSVQTLKGPTSIRLHYNSGLFRLDAAPTLAPHMPVFDCVVKLVEYYVQVTPGRDRSEHEEQKTDTGVWTKGARGHVWVDALGGPHSPVEVRRPLLSAPPKLAHAARLAVWGALRKAAPTTLPLQSPVRQLGLPLPLQDYLEEYPYTC